VSRSAFANNKNGIIVCSSSSAVENHPNNDDSNSLFENEKTTQRRQILKSLFFATTMSTLPNPTHATVEESATPTNKEEQSSSSGGGQLTPAQISNLLSIIPTFTLVEKSTGVPYAVVGEDAKLTSYFFTSYKEASRILSLASTSADKSVKEVKAQLKMAGKSKEEIDEEIGSNPWKNAVISVVSLDFAVSLVYAAQSSKRRNNMYFKVAPEEDVVEEAIALSTPKIEELEEGKVPLFYMEDFAVLGKEGEKKTPLYFNKEELVNEWKLQQKGNKEKVDMPPIKVTELFAVLNEMVNPNNTDPDIPTLYFVPPKNSSQKAKECQIKNKKNGLDSPFVIGTRIVVL